MSGASANTAGSASPIIRSQHPAGAANQRAWLSGAGRSATGLALWAAMDSSGVVGHRLLPRLGIPGAAGDQRVAPEARILQGIGNDHPLVLEQGEAADRIIDQIADWADIKDLRERIVVRRIIGPADLPGDRRGIRSAA